MVNFGTPEAISALVKRLGVNFRDTIKNEQEKTWVSSVLVERFGSEAVQPMMDYIRTEQTISAVIMTLGRIIDDEATVAFLVETLKQYEPSDHRSMSARLQLIDALTDYKDETVVEACLPYVLDHDDDIRIKVMDLISERTTKTSTLYAQIIDGLISVLTDPPRERACDPKSGEHPERLGF